jgi:hypothetical protein
MQESRISELQDVVRVLESEGVKKVCNLLLSPLSLSPLPSLSPLETQCGPHPQDEALTKLRQRQGIGLKV